MVKEDKRVGLPGGIDFIEEGMPGALSLEKLLEEGLCNVSFQSLIKVGCFLVTAKYQIRVLGSEWMLFFLQKKELWEN